MFHRSRILGIVLTLLCLPSIETSWSEEHFLFGIEKISNEPRLLNADDRGSPRELKRTHALKTIRVVVTLRMEDFQPEGLLPSSQAVEEQRQRVHAMQTTVLADLKSSSPTHIRRHKFTPKLTMVIVRAALDALSNHPNVQSVQQDVPSPPSAR